jgi:hypothetical protein
MPQNQHITQKNGIKKLAKKSKVINFAAAMGAISLYGLFIIYFLIHTQCT